MHYELRYKDKIFLLPDDESPYADEYYTDENLVWENREHESRWGIPSDNPEENEHWKMEQLDNQYNFTDWENAPNFVHVTYQYKYKVTKKETKLVEVKWIARNDLVNEWYNT